MDWQGMMLLLWLLLLLLLYENTVNSSFFDVVCLLVIPHACLLASEHVPCHSHCFDRCSSVVFNRLPGTTCTNSCEACGVALAFILSQTARLHALGQPLPCVCSLCRSTWTELVALAEFHGHLHSSHTLLAATPSSNRPCGVNKPIEATLHASQNNPPPPSAC